MAKKVKKVKKAIRARPAKRAVSKKARAVKNVVRAKSKPERPKVEKIAKSIESKGRTRKEVLASILPPEQVRAAVEGLSGNVPVSNYLKKNVSKHALEVVAALDTPKTDEALAEQLGMKINAVRRILNIMQGYGITNYYIAKNVNGWLSFAWYVNVAKLPVFVDYIEKIENKRPTVSEDCNDYFRCHGCYDQTKLIFTFDAAFEQSFKCGTCGRGLTMMDRLQATQLLDAAASEEMQPLAAENE